MTTEPFHLIDPELLIPSAAGRDDLSFWDRLLSWVEVAEWRVGAASLEVFEESIDVAETSVISKRDFWAIVGKVVHRGFEPASSRRRICEGHLRSAYSPVLGAADNIDLLVEDLSVVGDSPHVALSTDVACWTDLDSTCDTCSASRVHYIGDAADSAALSALVWRASFLDQNPASVGEVERMADSMFPAVSFSESAWRRTGTLIGAPTDIVRDVVTHLAVLNDHVPRIWGEQTTTVARQAELGSLGVAASPESPQTLRNRTARRERVFEFSGREVECLWHTKLRPEGNRIHFAVEDGRVFVGTIVDHLST